MAISRHEFLEALHRLVSEANADATHLGLLLIDIGGLTRINHAHSYALGDRVLSIAHSELMAMSKLADTVFRIGSHSYAFLLPELGNPALIALAINKVSSQLRASLSAATDGLSVDVYVGVAVNHAGQNEPLDMLATAESSLRHVRAGGDQGLEGLIEGPAEKIDDSHLEQQFVTSLRENDFQLHYQPKVNLATGEVESVEALLRWSAEDGESVSPESVVALAAGMGRSFELTKWIVSEAFRQARSWQDSLGVGVAVNIQAELVSSPDLVPMLRDAAAIWGVRRESVTIEITENAIIEDKEAGFSNLNQILDSGMNISIDDFGTGYSSLSYFKHIPASELKIDKSFVQSLLGDSRERELVKIMIQIAREFDMSVVGEGVEDVATLRQLEALGCDYGQGFLFASPMPAAQFEHWISQRSSSATGLLGASIQLTENSE